MPIQPNNTQSKPLAVLLPDHARQSAATGAEAGDAHWRVAGVVRRKLVFKTRPQPVVVKRA